MSATYVPTAQITQLTQHYVQNIMPLEPITQTIMLQIQQIHELEAKLQKLGKVQQLTTAEQQILNQYKDSMQRNRMQQHNKWTKESMTRLRDKYEGEFLKKKMEIQEQIGLKSMTFNCSMDNMNVLSNLENSTENLEFVITKAEVKGLAMLKQHMVAYQNVLEKVGNFEEAEEIDRLLKLVHQREK